MKHRARVPVNHWSDGPVILRRSRPFRVPSAALGLIGTLWLHVFVFRSVLLGTHVHKIRPPDLQGPGATLIRSADEPSESLVLIDIPAAEMASKPLPEDLASLGSAAQNLMVTIISPDALPHVEIPPDSQDIGDDPTVPLDSGDPAARAQLFGRYSGQIQARVERAWRRPRSPVRAGNDPRPRGSRAAGGSPAADRFRCQVRILQDAHGAVREVQMLDCPGSVPWQQSLVTAILSASPLPAPPSPSVFTQSLTMTFEAQTYSPDSVPDEYEIERTGPSAFSP